ncbi:MAG: DUF4397 domain-containing protein [Actinobacteria bacterium]|nr:DUF4397 domain-containing protein [Actinomycetota bacterium]
MKFPSAVRRITVLAAALALLLGLPAAAASASAAAAGSGWLRLAHFSPNTPPVDVYLYSFGNSSAMIVLHHVAYGTVSPYEEVAAGDYSVAMRGAGSPASSPAVLSTSVNVVAGHSYTVAGMGPESGLRLEVLDDSLTAPAGKSSVRVIQASLKQQTVEFHCSCAPGTAGDLAANASFASVSPYAAIAPGTWTMSATGPSAATSRPVALAAGTVHTAVVLDGANGLEIADLVDAAGAGKPPAGGVRTGLGGTAPHGPGSPAPWLAIIGAGALITVAGGLRLRRSGPRRQLDAGV